MKRILVLSFIAAGFYMNAQTIGNSPYAAFGIGDVKYDNSVDHTSMGGISTAYISDFPNFFNFKNPAANTNMELATVELDGTNENNFFKSDYNNMSATKHSTYVSNISIAFPLSRKVKFGMGYQPYSSKRYSVANTETLADGTTKIGLFRGEGTLNTVQAAVSYQIVPEFALGFRTNFYFGNLYDINEITYSNAELINGHETRNKVKTFNFTLGSVYQKKFADDKKFTAGATYTFGNTGNMETYYTNSTYFYSQGETKNEVSIIEFDDSADKNLIPMEFSLGLGYGDERKWFLGTQFDYKKGETVQFLGNPFEYQNGYKMAVGGWYLPNENNFRNYFSRVTYRYGLYYQKGNLELNGKSINQFALTGGVNLPFDNRGVSRMSSVDLGLELGKRGTLENNLVNQTFINFRVGLNFADRWFLKRLYD